jgi:peroxin-7
VAVACCDNFGIVGKGKLLILNIVPHQPMEVVRVFEEHDAIFDCAWSEGDVNHIISGCGDGEVRLWDVGSGKLLFKSH